MMVPMESSLTAQISGQVRRLSQQRGRLYFLRGAVNILEGDPWSVEATVQGTRMYSVSLSRVKESLSVLCNCPYNENYLEPCKHIWATLLAAEKQGSLGGSGDSGLLHIEEPDPEVFPAEDEEEIPPLRAKQPPLSWNHHLARVRETMEGESLYRRRWPPDREILYIVDVLASLSSQRLTVEVAQREPKRDGAWGKLKSLRIRSSQISDLPDPADRRIMSLLLGARDEMIPWSSYHHSPYVDYAPYSYLLSEPLWDVVLPLICATDRCRLRRSVNSPELRPIQWNDGEPWEFWLKLELGESGEQYSVTGWLRRGEAELSLSTPVMLLKGGLVFYEDHTARLEDFGGFGWISLLRERESFFIPIKQAGDFIAGLFQLPRWPRLELPEELRVEEISLKPKPQLMLRTRDRFSGSRNRMVGELSFEYDGEIIPHKHPGRGVYQPERHRLVVRDAGVELAAEQRLKELGFRGTSFTEHQELELLPSHLPTVVQALLSEGWHVEAQGKQYRVPGQLRIEVSSGDRLV